MRRVLVALVAAAGVSLVAPAVSMADTIFPTAENQQFSGTVDSSTSCPRGNASSATINWGDGSSSPADGNAVTVSNNSVSGTHTYSEEGTYDSTSGASVVVVCAIGPPVTDALTADVPDASLTAGPSGAVSATATVQFSGPVSTFSDADPGGSVGDYAVTIDWGDGSSSAGSVSGPSGGQFTVSGTHTYATPGSYFISMRVTDQSQQGGSGGQSRSTTSVSATATVGKAPPAFPQCPPAGVNNGCQFLITFSNRGKTVFQDPNQGPYESSEDALIGVVNQSSKPIYALPLSATGLFSFDSDGICNPGSGAIPNGCRPARGEPAGSTCGPQSDVCSFPAPAGQPPGYVEPGAVRPNRQNGYEGPTTWFSNVSRNLASGHVNFSPPLQPGQSTYFSLEEPPSATALRVGAATQPFVPLPVLGKSVDVYVISGIVYVRVPAHPSLDIAGDPLAIGAAAASGPGFVPLTEPRQVPVGTQIDTRRGKIKLVSATGKGRRTQSGAFNGALFSVTQTKRGHDKGLTTLSLLEGAFRGGPSYSSCGRAADVPTAGAHPAKVSSKVLQALHASAHGRFTTRGRFSAATVRGTAWGEQDRCDGSLTIVRRGTVVVTDFVHHQTILVHAGQKYLARRR